MALLQEASSSLDLFSRYPPSILGGRARLFRHRYIMPIMRVSFTGINFIPKVVQRHRQLSPRIVHPSSELR
jgi:hypothetical protein